jgi:prephenate dehydrogenase
VSGARAIPGKHGQPSTRAATLFLLIPDEPGALARLFAAASEVSVNIEDVRIDHDPARPVGLLELSVAEEGADRLVEALNSRGWTVHR